MHFRLLGTNGFYPKAKNETCCCGLAGVPGAARLFFLFQSIKALIFGVVFALPSSFQEVTTNIRFDDSLNMIARMRENKRATRAAGLKDFLLLHFIIFLGSC